MLERCKTTQRLKDLIKVCCSPIMKGPCDVTSIESGVDGFWMPFPQQLLVWSRNDLNRFWGKDTTLKLCRPLYYAYFCSESEYLQNPPGLQPKPQTLNPKPQALKPSTLNPQNPKPLPDHRSLSDDVSRIR